MHKITVASAALNQTPLDWDQNFENIVKAIESAKALGAQVLCLPELCIPGYGCEDRFFSADLRERALHSLKAILPHTSAIVVCVGLPIAVDGVLYNCSALLADKEIVGFVPKQNLAGDGIYYEPRWFKPWPSGKWTEFVSGDISAPLGDIVFDVSGLRIGFEICEDAWVAKRTGARLSERGVDLILNPSASHFSFGKHEIRKRLALEGSRAFQCVYLYSNLLGCESGRIIYDGDTIIACGGELVASGNRFSFKDLSITAGVIDIHRNRLSRTKLLSYRPDYDGGPEVSFTPFRWSSTTKEQSKQSVNHWESGPYLKEEEFTRSVMLGLFDYLRKSHSNGFVVSLSGGVDSSAASCLVSEMIHFAIQELGLAGYKDKLSYIPNSKAWKSEANCILELLTCVYQKTANSGKVTQNAAGKVAKEIGAKFLEFDIEPLVKDYVSLVSGSIKRKIEWGKDDLALQNVQARVRSPGIWMLANIAGALLLSTSNRSEAAVGYTTMDGDTSGGLSPLGGIDKAFLRKWLKWLEREGPEGGYHYESLSYVNEQEPTAELRPQKDKQTDERDLMPYEVLDKIERFAIRDQLAPKATFECICQEFSKKHSEDDLRNWTIKFFKLWSRNQWKRERYAPSFHLDDENLDPKTWCRFPILSGSFERELSELSDLKLRNKSRKK